VTTGSNNTRIAIQRLTLQVLTVGLLQAEEVKELFGHGCRIRIAERQPLGDTTLKVGQILGPLDQSQNVTKLVRDVGGSLRQTLSMNPSRINLISEFPLVADLMHSYGDRRLCLISSLSEECPALPYWSIRRIDQYGRARCVVAIRGIPCSTVLITPLVCEDDDLEGQRGDKGPGLSRWFYWARGNCPGNIINYDATKKTDMPRDHTLTRAHTYKPNIFSYISIIFIYNCNVLLSECSPDMWIAENPKKDKAILREASFLTSLLSQPHPFSLPFFLFVLLSLYSFFPHILPFLH